MINRYLTSPECGVRLDSEDPRTGPAVDLDNMLRNGTASLWVRDKNSKHARVLLERRDLIVLRNGINHILDQEALK